MIIRTDADIENLRKQGDLTSAEETLIKNCRAGQPTRLGDGTVPAGPSDARSVRADLLRYLICGGCEDCPTQDTGLDLSGAHVTGRLDLDFATAKGRTGLYHCRFDRPIEALQARFEFLNLNGSHLPGLNAQGARVTGGVFLRALTATGEVRLSGAVIGGQLDCEGAELSNAEGKALNAEGARVTGDVFLRALKATGEVRLSGAVIGGQLDCTRAELSNAEGQALNAQKMEVEEFHWRMVKAVKGGVDLNGAKASVLADDAKSWDLVDTLYLNGFRYDHIHGPVTARMRLNWIAKDAASAGEFSPHPYEQLAQVFRALGHEADRRAVLIEKERLQRADERKRLSGVSAFARRIGKRCFDFLSWVVIGYGYRPFQVLWALLILLLIGWGMAYQAWHSGDFAPNSDVILSTPEWQALAEDAAVANPAVEWSARYGAGRDWETFSAGAYAFDIVVPIVTIGQTQAWAPSTTRGPWGRHMWWARWALTVLGWIVTAVGAAAITGIIRRE